MNVQSTPPEHSRQKADKKQIIQSAPGKQDSFESAKSTILAHITGRNDGSLFGSTATGFSGLDIPKETSIAGVTKKSIVPMSSSFSTLSRQVPHTGFISGDNVALFTETQNPISNVKIPDTTRANSFPASAIRASSGPENLSFLEKQSMFARAKIVKPENQVSQENIIKSANTVSSNRFQKLSVINQLGEQTGSNFAKTKIPNSLILKPPVLSKMTVPKVSDTQQKPYISPPVNIVSPFESVQPVDASVNTMSKPANFELAKEQQIVPGITASTIFNNRELENENSKILNGQELAAERIIAGMANPMLKDMPVDSELAAALNEMSGVNPIDPKSGFTGTLVKRHVNRKRHVNDAPLHKPRKREIIEEKLKHDKYKVKFEKRDQTESKLHNTISYKTNIQKRGVTEDVNLRNPIQREHYSRKLKGQKQNIFQIDHKNLFMWKNGGKNNFHNKRFRKRQINETKAKKINSNALLSAGHKRYLKLTGKRDATDKIKSAKAIERSKMSLPLVSTQQGPKLMDKIRDMSRVIATP